jgi:hypothetical protein
MFALAVFQSEKGNIGRICESMKHDTASFLLHDMSHKKGHYHEIILLGNSYRTETANFFYSRHITFWATRLFFKDSLVSASFYPSLYGIYYTAENNFVKECRKCGFDFKRNNQDVWQYDGIPTYYRQNSQYIKSGYVPDSIISSHKQLFEICSPFEITMFQEKTPFANGSFPLIDSIYANCSDNDIEILADAINPIGRGVGAAIIQAKEINKYQSIYQKIINEEVTVRTIWEDLGSEMKMSAFVNSIVEHYKTIK